MENDKISPMKWAKLKEFCNSLTDEQLEQYVYLQGEDSQTPILYASEIGSDHYKFDDEEFSVSKDDFDPDYHLDGKYKTFEEALLREKNYSITPASNVYLFDL